MSISESLFDQALSLHTAGDLASAEPIYRAAIELDARDSRSTQMLGVLAFQTGRATLALELLRRAIELAPQSASCYGHLGLVLASVGQTPQAIVAYRQAIELKPDLAPAYVNLGNALRQTGDRDGAADAYRRAIEFSPDFPEAHNNLGLLLSDSGHFSEAVAVLRRVCELRPDDAEPQLNLANALFRTDDLAAAAQAYARALELRPDSVDAWNNLGSTLDRLHKPAEAIEAFEAAVRIQPDFAEGHFNLALARRGQGRHGDAIAAGQRAVELRPAWPEAWNNLGIWLQEIGKLDMAGDALTRAIAAKPDYPEALCNLGNMWRQLGRLPEAIAAYRRAFALRPDYAEAMSNLGATLNQAGDVDEAMAMLCRAIEQQPDLSEAHNNLGNVLRDTAELDGALACWSRATELRPDDAAAHSNVVYTLLFHPTADACGHLDAAVAWGRRHAAPLTRHAMPHPNDRASNRRLRIGYVAPNFRDHCQSFFTLPLLSNHDHDRFEIICYSDVPSPDSMTERIRACADVWRGTVGMSDDALAAQIRDDRVDVLVDLTLHMAHHRLLTFARKPAPVQVTWLGYPGTTGMEAIDYRLSDPYLDPPGTERDALYTERTVRLPDTFWCYDALMDGLNVGDLPVARNGFITFGCLNNFCKVNDGTLRLWARVLRRVPGSRLLLLTPDGAVRNRVLDVLRQEGIDAPRVEFVGRQSRRRYLETYRRIDIGLDTFPYNGHTTSLDSYWMGVPVVTMVGDSVVSRAGWSQLSNLDLPSLAACDEDQFVSIAEGLACDIDRLNELRTTLRQRLMLSPLCDAPRFARNVEAAYLQMWQAWIAGAPDLRLVA